MAKDYCIWIVTPPGYIHSRCFEEIALGLREAFSELGYDAPIVTDAADARGTAIALGANLIRPATPLPAHCILYNLEQLGPDCPWVTPGYVDLLRRYPVWDFSKKNITYLAEHGVQAALCEIGYMPALTRIAPAPNREIDVAFVGSINDRRFDVLKALQDQGKKVFPGFNLYGAERDAVYARAKIVLNIHFYAAKVFEIVRCSYLLANRLCVVSELGSEPEVERQYDGGIAFARYEDLASRCLRLLADDDARRALADHGFEAFSARSQTQFLKAALAATASLRS